MAALLLQDTIQSRHARLLDIAGAAMKLITQSQGCPEDLISGYEHN